MAATAAATAVVAMVAAVMVVAAMVVILLDPINKRYRSQASANRDVGGLLRNHYATYRTAYLLTRAGRLTRTLTPTAYAYSLRLQLRLHERSSRARALIATATAIAAAAAATAYGARRRAAAGSLPLARLLARRLRPSLFRRPRHEGVRVYGGGHGGVGGVEPGE